jgi:drug/metabolite transporter (DMT)-like permease
MTQTTLPSGSNTRAIGLLLFGITAGVGLDFCGKWLLVDYSLSEFVFLRSIFGAVIMLALANKLGGLGSLKTRRIGWHLVRAVLATAAMFGFFYGLSQIPLVDCFAIGFTAPLFTTALAPLFLGDHVGWRRWSAVLFGFAGTLVVLRPGLGMLSWASLSVLAAAFAYACMSILARKLADTESSYALSTYSLIGPMAVAAILLPGQWATPTTNAWLGFALAGLFSACAWIGLVGGYRRAPPAVLAPFEYTALIWGTLGGYFIWGEIPDRWVLIGAGMIAGSGLFVAYREMRAHLTSSARYLRVMTTSAAAVQEHPENPGAP